MLSNLISIIYSIIERFQFKDNCRELMSKEVHELKKSVDKAVEAVVARPYLQLPDSSHFTRFRLNQSLTLIIKMLKHLKESNFDFSIFNKIGENLFLKSEELEILSNKELVVSRIEEALPEMLLNVVSVPKIGPSALVVPVLPPFEMTFRRPLLSELLASVYENNRQTEKTYHLKLNLRQKIYSLFSKKMRDNFDLYLIGSSSTRLGSDSSDTDLCLIIYDSDHNIDTKYEDRNNVIKKLEELKEILLTNDMSVNLELIPALVPILKFIEKSSGIEVNLNLNRTVTIRNTHLMYLYSQMDERVAPLVVAIKVWARKNAINSAFNKSLTSYSIGLMAIHYLQSVCKPPVVPCLQQLMPDLFESDVTKLRLSESLNIKFKSSNIDSVAQLFTGFIEYFTLRFPFDKVISVRTGSLIDRSEMMANQDKVWQWKCHLCIEEPFDRTNTSHAVHDCRVFQHILNAFMETLLLVQTNKLNAKNFM